MLLLLADRAPADMLDEDLLQARLADLEVRHPVPARDRLRNGGYAGR